MQAARQTPSDGHRADVTSCSRPWGRRRSPSWSSGTSISTLMTSRKTHPRTSGPLASNSLAWRTIMALPMSSGTRVGDTSPPPRVLGHIRYGTTRRVLESFLMAYLQLHRRSRMGTQSGISGARRSRSGSWTDSSSSCGAHDRLHC